MSKSALVISGGGSKGAFAGGVAQYLIENDKQEYDIFMGTSTGSLLISHLASNKINAIKQAFTHVTQASIFSNNPFVIKQKGKIVKTKINHFNVIKNFIRGKKTFGESLNLRQLLSKEISPSLFEAIKTTSSEVVVCVSNLTLNKIEFKSISDCSYDDFIDWIWISCNYLPFMSLVVKNRYEYADGGFGCIIAIEEAIKRGATHVDAIVLTTEEQQLNRMRSRNAFDLLLSTFDFMGNQIYLDNLKVGELLAKKYNVKLRLFYTPRVLTTNSLVFNQQEMEQWWSEGWEHTRKMLKNNRQ
jgi:predicted patatin/cPLA2 family phospholipase